MMEMDENSGPDRGIWLLLTNDHQEGILLSITALGVWPNQDEDCVRKNKTAGFSSRRAAL